MTLRDPPERQSQALGHTVPLDRFDGIRRAGGMKAATRATAAQKSPPEGREALLAPDDQNQNPFHDTPSHNPARW